MGQYFHIVNNTKKEYLHDHKFHDIGLVGGHGIKWGEIVFGNFTSLQLLAILISSDTSFGSRQNPSFTGDWGGDSISLYGDNSAEIEFERVCKEYTDITPKLLTELMKLSYWRDMIVQTGTQSEREKF